MFTKDFTFDLPKELIAQYPASTRGEDRLLVVNRKTGSLTDALFSDLPHFLPPDCLMVFNNAKVRHARLYARTEAGEAEFLLIEPLDEGYTWQTLIKRAKRQKAGKRYTFADGTAAVLIPPPPDADTGSLYIRFDRCIDDSWLEKNGHIPLPPYIKRQDTETDAKRYQTVYAKTGGSVAAPTAGLHFTEAVLEELNSRHIARADVTLHVGLGTFLPVRTQTIEEHIMHTEKFFIPDDAAEAVETAHRQKRPVVAVGTTSVRTLESAWREKDQRLERGSQATNIFIYPGYKFEVTDMLLTNFHTPESTLLMLVSAFAGQDLIFSAYRHAVEQKYRFFSYGDAMLIL